MNDKILAGVSNSPLEVQKLNLRTQLSEKYGFVAIKIDRLTIMGNVELEENQVFQNLRKAPVVLRFQREGSNTADEIRLETEADGTFRYEFVPPDQGKYTVVRKKLKIVIILLLCFSLP